VCRTCSKWFQCLNLSNKKMHKMVGNPNAKEKMQWTDMKRHFSEYGDKIMPWKWSSLTVVSIIEKGQSMMIYINIVNMGRQIIWWNTTEHRNDLTLSAKAAPVPFSQENFLEILSDLGNPGTLKVHFVRLRYQWWDICTESFWNGLQVYWCAINRSINGGIKTNSSKDEWMLACVGKYYR